jgi:pyridoxal biosynthesis lyase PdxS
MAEAKRLGAPFELLRVVRRESRLPVPNFAAGGIATPADAALCMQAGGANGVRRLRDIQVRGPRRHRSRNREGHGVL